MLFVLLYILLITIGTLSLYHYLVSLLSLSVDSFKVQVLSFLSQLSSCLLGACICIQRNVFDTRFMLLSC